MTETSPVEELKRYIYDETEEAERARLDARFFEDDELFPNYLELENDLTDRYSQGVLPGEDLQRFERGLAKNPARREKLKTARALQRLAAAEKAKAPAILAAPDFWEQVKEFFTLKVSAVQLAGAALIIAVLCIGGFLIYQIQKANDYAEIERRREAERNERENRLRELVEQQRRAEEANWRREQNDQITKETNAAINQASENVVEETEICTISQRIKKEI